MLEKSAPFIFKADEWYLSTKIYGITLQITVFWDVMLQGLVDHYQLSEESAASIFTLLPKEQAAVSS
jgi:hypothetical protein